MWFMLWKPWMILFVVAVPDCVCVCVCVCLVNVKLSQAGHNKWLWFRQSTLFCSVSLWLWNLFEFWALLWVYNQCQIISSRSNHKILYGSLDIYLSALRAKQIVSPFPFSLSLPSRFPSSDIKLSSEQLIECQGCSYASFAAHWFPHPLANPPPSDSTFRGELKFALWNCK